MDIEKPAQLLAYLHTYKHIAPDETPRITTLSGGVSNRTVLVERENGDAWVIKQALEKLRVPVDWFSSPARIHREAEGLRWLVKLAPPGTLPDFVFEDHEYHLLAMQAIPQPHANWKTLLLKGQIELDHFSQFATLLATIHGNVYQRRDEIAPVFADTSFFESLRLEPYYAYTATQVPTAAAFFHSLIVDTRACQITLTHGDYSPKNILIYNDRLILLDHEVIHWGDPAFDLGFSLTHLLSKAHHLLEHRALLQEAARLYWQTYAQVNAAMVTPEMEARAVRHTLACLLARVAGRSPLEYLSTAERELQRECVIAIIPNPPDSILTFIDVFLERL